MLKIGITGGIGSGKSTLCKLFEAHDIAVYYSDIEAKRLMTEDQSIRQAIIDQFGEECYEDDVLNRPHLASKVFGDDERLKALNSIVHPKVREEFVKWCANQEGNYVLLESAILFDSGFDSMVDVKVAVLAPQSLRIERITLRDGLTSEQIKSRIEAQMSDDELARLADYCVVNISEDDLSDALNMLDSRFKYEASKI